jgi:hypothetical protein
MAFDKIMLKRIKKIPGVEMVEVSKDEKLKNQLIVHTEMIQLRSPCSKKLYDVGRFKIVFKNTGFIEYRQQTLCNPSFINKDIEHTKQGIFFSTPILHPHLFGNGPCWGNILDSIQPAVDNKDFFLATILCLQFLKNINPNGSYTLYLENTFPLSKGADEHETKPKK